MRGQRNVSRKKTTKAKNSQGLQYKELQKIATSSTKRSEIESPANKPTHSSGVSVLIAHLLLDLRIRQRLQERAPRLRFGWVSGNSQT